MKSCSRMVVICCFFYVAFVSGRILFNGRRSGLFAQGSIQPRRLGKDEFVNFITPGYPYYMGNIGENNFETVQVPFDKEEIALSSQLDEEKQPPLDRAPLPQNFHYVYNSMHLPGYSNDPFSYYAMAKAWDPYLGLRPPFNLQPPSNDLLGMQTFGNPSFAPLYPSLYQDPFKTGIYGGYGYGMYGTTTPYLLNPLPAPRLDLAAEIARLKMLVQQLEKQNQPLALQSAEKPGPDAQMPIGLKEDKPNPLQNKIDNADKLIPQAGEDKDKDNVPRGLGNTKGHDDHLDESGSNVQNEEPVLLPPD